MIGPHIIDPDGLLSGALSQASPDLMRDLLQSVVNVLGSADADAVCGAQWGKPAPGCQTQRNGYRHRPLDTRVSTIDIAIPKLRSGTYFPGWLLQRRKRAETALTRSWPTTTSLACPRAAWTSSSKPSGSRACPSHRSRA